MPWATHKQPPATLFFTPCRRPALVAEAHTHPSAGATRRPPRPAGERLRPPWLRVSAVPQQLTHAPRPSHDLTPAGHPLPPPAAALGTAADRGGAAAGGVPLRRGRAPACAGRRAAERAAHHGCHPGRIQHVRCGGEGCSCRSRGGARCTRKALKRSPHPVPPSSPSTQPCLGLPAARATREAWLHAAAGS